ncbi:hypothetical protein RHMOL_Rhmol08G0194500 [Rhododendron molle]|uniref:Uncharacterized protein n=2 Tax=Rhododendron molle TaxID=49168 RepID=A0ACC0MQV9_RHOML|nr:hypothetical protein RHMOL_Rhmol08G0194500 [Rhododendron molle]KAI8543136.1 hypothetical protein RHMOL_Rhmol08G0194500 [Rhododendron molle]
MFGHWEFDKSAMKYSYRVISGAEHTNWQAWRLVLIFSVEFAAGRFIDLFFPLVLVLFCYCQWHNCFLKLQCYSYDLTIIPFSDLNEVLVQSIG